MAKRGTYKLCVGCSHKIYVFPCSNRKFCSKNCLTDFQRRTKVRVISKCWKCEERISCFPSAVRKFCNNTCYKKFTAIEGDSSLRNTSLWSTEEMRGKLRKAWTKKRRRELSVRMKKGSKLQNLLQHNGNELRKGKPNRAARRWWLNASKKFKKEHAEAISRRLSTSYRGWPSKGFVTGVQGFLKTRLGRIRFDSSWERDFLLRLSDDSQVKSVTRDYAIPYRTKGVLHHFLVDFFVEFKKRNPILVEIKCPYFLGEKKTKTKIRAAKRFARKHNMRFVLLKSKEQVEVAEYAKAK